jgi:TonB family protein
MRTVSQLLLNFLVNACWQITLIAIAASVCSWLLRNVSARYRHLLWVVAFVMALGLPLLKSPQLSTPGTTTAIQKADATEFNVSAGLDNVLTEVPPASTAARNPAQKLQLSEKVALILAVLYLLVVLYRGLRLGQAWHRTRKIRKGARPLDPDEHLGAIIRHCQTVIGIERVEVWSSTDVSVPITVGMLNPIVVLPERLLRALDDEVLTSAIGHELVHILRRDYLRNLLFELIYLPLSFHPAAALIRRRIKQTRELSCDELVTDKLLAAEVYAHSLVQLAGSALPFGRHATLTVGITDADILEVRIMSLLRKSKLNRTRAKLLLLAASVLLATPCVAAAAFSLSFDIALQDPAALASETQREISRARLVYKVDPEYTEEARANKIEGTVGLVAVINPKGTVESVTVTKPLYPSLDESAVSAIRKWRFEPLIKDGQPASQKYSVEMVFRMSAGQQDARKREEQERMRARELEEKQRAQSQTDEEQARKRELEMRELEERAKTDLHLRAELEERARHMERERKERDEAGPFAMELGGGGLEAAKWARITMEQAIQIATSQYPGKVLESRLLGEREDRVFYRVMIVNGDDTRVTITFVLVNAIDGTISKTERAERPRESSRGVIFGGVLNSKAISLPNPNYPAIARQAQASGTVTVEITVDEDGNVIAARAVSGHPLLQAASVDVARLAKFSPTLLSGEPVKIRGVLVFNFVAQ